MAIELNQKGIRVFFCKLYNHDYLWFSSSEISKVSVTYPVIHNYALSYSLSDHSYGIYLGSTPRYEEDLVRMPLYATPAVAEFCTKTTITYNAMDDRTLRTDTGPSGALTPMLGQRVYIDPVFEFNGGPAIFGFRFYIFTFDGSVPRGVARIGKKRIPVRVKWEEIENPRVIYKEDEVQPTHPINPLDLTGEAMRYEIINIPPHLLLRNATVKADWFVFLKRHAIQVPKRVIGRV